ncbi:MAG: tetratricopeptide repeat protein [Planctomycetota bacterium]|nr:tetratricopeptide repeat protein [Planctomycetota bacterium]
MGAAVSGRWLLSLAVCLALRAGEEPAVSDLLARLRQAAPQEVVEAIDRWPPPLPAALALARGEAQWRLALAAADPAAPLAAAERDFRAALAAAHTARAARWGLARCAALRGAWSSALAEASAALAGGDGEAEHFAFLAECALRAGDRRLATLAVQQGILRFPSERRLRRLELQLLLAAEQAAEAASAARALLAADPDDSELWRALAWAAERLGNDAEARAALEAALACAPADAELRRQLASRQWAAGQALAALATLRPLLSEPAAADPALLAWAAELALASDEVPLARQWLEAVPSAQRGRVHHRLAAQAALRAGERAAAQAAIAALLELGEDDPAVLVWAGQLAEEAGEAPRAEALYRQALAGGGQAAPAARLRLIALCLRQQRRDEARALLDRHLAEQPDDGHARALWRWLAETAPER